MVKCLGFTGHESKPCVRSWKGRTDHRYTRVRVQSSIGQAGFSIGQNCPVPIDEKPCPELESASDRIHMCAVRTSRANIVRDPRFRSNYSGCRRLPLAHRPSLPFGGNAVPIFNRFHYRAIGREISGGTVRKVQILGRRITETHPTSYASILP